MQRSSRTSIALGLIGLVGLLAVVAPAPAVTYKRIASKTASGDFAVVIASATAKRPKGIYVAVTAVPRQPVSVNWSVVCSRGTGAGSKSGDYTTSSSAKRKLRLPMLKPDSCSVSAGGQLERGGKITVRLYKR